MAIGKVKVGESHERLMFAIGDAIRVQTSVSPMSEEDILGVLGFTLGCAIARASKGRIERRQLREMAVANVDNGLQAMTSSMANTSLILPDGIQ
jgi:ADP-dependent phosphofructokinase/glucokinase